MTIIEIGLLCLVVVLIAAVIFLLVQFRKITKEIEYIHYRIDPVRLNFLWGAKILLCKQERYEEIKELDELIEEEYGEEAIKNIDVNNLMDFL